MTQRPETKTDYQASIMRVMLLIQARLDAPPSLDEVAAVAAFSPYHFHRLFTAYTGESLSAFVRRLRLERAANRLRQTFDAITEIALDAGYETPANFSKAFKQQFGQSPSAYREENHLLDTAVFQQTRTQEPPKMTPKIVNLEPQTVLFVRKTGPYSEASAAAFAALMPFAYRHKLIHPSTQMIGISHDSPDITDPDKLRYDACLTLDQAVEPQGEFGVQTIAGGRYALFVHKGAYELFDETYRLVFGQWLAHSGEQLRDAPIFERYLNRDPRRTKPENLRTEIYIPLSDA
ncbi:MAG: AraC family transcriptional regulator [Ardenticatenaceae bacterium]|nr:AraC family transcriptional regulator [Anaerolineales bacterium]MCB8941934.1 AraC family transcriptional regulator [Ardenticatenaceae bacterium]MCB8973047.1 AraC family transcriptional regulator [Ardenticatenaceae bacterium]